MKIDTNALTRAQVAEMIGMSDSWVRDRMQAGDLPRPGVEANAYVEALVDYKLAQAASDPSVGAPGDLEYERTRLTAAQADAKEMANAVTRGELLPVGAFITALTAGVVDIRKRFLSQPSGLSQELLGITDRREMNERLTEDVHERLEALSEANFDAIMEAAFGGLVDGGIGGEASAETDAEPME